MARSRAGGGQRLRQRRLRPDHRPDPRRPAGQFAEYLVRVTEHLEDTHGITVDSIDPLNEPNTGTLTVTLPRAREVTRVVTHLYRDNSGGGGLPQSVRAGVPAGDGTCAGGTEIPVGVAGPLAVSAPLAATTERSAWC